MIRLGPVVLVPAGDQAPQGRQLAAEEGRLVLAAGGPTGDRCSIAARDAELIESAACGTYLRVGRATPIEVGERKVVDVEPGLYQVIRKQG